METGDELTRAEVDGYVRGLDDWAQMLYKQIQDARISIADTASDEFQCD